MNVKRAIAAILFSASGAALALLAGATLQHSALAYMGIFVFVMLSNRRRRRRRVTQADIHSRGAVASNFTLGISTPRQGRPINTTRDVSA